MDLPAQLRALMDLAEDLSIAIRHVPVGDSNAPGRDPGGALVRVKGKEIIFLDTQATLSDQIAAVAGALRGRGELKDRFLPPEIRDLIEQADD